MRIVITEINGTHEELLAAGIREKLGGLHGVTVEIAGATPPAPPTSRASKVRHVLAKPTPPTNPPLMATSPSASVFSAF